MKYPSEQLQKMTDATKACEDLEEVAGGLTTSISLMFLQDESGDSYTEIDIVLSLKEQLINLVKPLLEQEKEKALSGLTT